MTDDVHQAKVRGIPHRWKPGESGNPKGCKKKADCLISCIKDELAKLSELYPEKTREQVIAQSLCHMAERGNLKAIELVMEYTCVKPKAELDVTNKGKMEIIVRWDGNRNEGQNAAK